MAGEPQEIEMPVIDLSGESDFAGPPPVADSAPDAEAGFGDDAIG